ncbi:MAG: hypothetical protein FJX20_13115 [Alphaproteobacteria bacterium]|nr:hypothetical protein [Alphaproteobacteria bacterium]
MNASTPLPFIRCPLRRSAAGLALLLAAASAAWAQADAPAVKRMDGIWGLPPNCGGSAPINVLGDKVQFQWPGGERVLEQVTSVVGDRVATIVIAPPHRVGERYEYEVEAERMLIRVMRDGREQIVVRCGGAFPTS